jgi:NAD(P)H-hydrate epimerase
MKLVTTEKMRAIDSEAINNRGIPGPELMENAGRGIAEKIRDRILVEPEGKSIAILCGKGNNGGDGFVIGRHLNQYGCTVTIYFPDPVDKLSPDARLNHDRAKDDGIEIVPIKSKDQLSERLDVDIIIDAVFGTGFTGAPRGLLADFINYINSMELPVIAVDCPSGLNIDNGQYEGAVVQASFSFPLAAPKIGMYLSPGRELCGTIDVVPIGIPEDVFGMFDLRENLVTADDISNLLPNRKPNGHKGDFGKLFIVAGSTGLTGAAALAAKASARTGLGLVTVGCPASLNSILEIKLTEAMTHPLPDVGKKGALALRGLGEIKKEIADRDAVIIGPGIGQHRETGELIRRLVSQIDKPSIIDADGLNAFATDRKPLAGNHPEMVLTPHPGEFKRLIDEDLPDEPSAIFDLVRSYADKYNSVIVLKGSPTIIVDTDGQLYLNPTGNNGMATGGTGDVLSGMIGSFLAQGLSSLGSAIAGVYLHGLAGDLAASELGFRSLIAGDLIDFLPEAFNMVEPA